MPISGCPSLIYPPPIPVPMVRYKEGSSLLQAPQMLSPIAAALTSRSKAIFTWRARCKVPHTSVLLQCGFGVDEIKPYVEDSRFRSSGPKQPTPIALICPEETKGWKY